MSRNVERKSTATAGGETKTKAKAERVRAVPVEVVLQDIKEVKEQINALVALNYLLGSRQKRPRGERSLMGAVEYKEGVDRAELRAMLRALQQRLGMLGKQYAAVVGRRNNALIEEYKRTTPVGAARVDFSKTKVPANARAAYYPNVVADLFAPNEERTQILPIEFKQQEGKSKTPSRYVSLAAVPAFDVLTRESKSHPGLVVGSTSTLTRLITLYAKKNGLVFSMTPEELASFGIAENAPPMLQAVIVFGAEDRQTPEGKISLPGDQFLQRLVQVAAAQAEINGHTQPTADGGPSLVQSLQDIAAAGRFTYKDIRKIVNGLDVTTQFISRGGAVGTDGAFEPGTAWTKAFLDFVAEKEIDLAAGTPDEQAATLERTLAKFREWYSKQPGGMPTQAEQTAVDEMNRIISLAKRGTSVEEVERKAREKAAAAAARAGRQQAGRGAGRGGRGGRGGATAAR